MSLFEQETTTTLFTDMPHRFSASLSTNTALQFYEFAGAVDAVFCFNSVKSETARAV